jgi:AcrR family transcriptional regulator
MSPRPYQLGRRQADIDEGRRRILDAARELLAETTHYTAFTVDAVAKRADVARATVYYQFGSKTGLLEALCDSLADRGGMSGLAQAFTAIDPDDALRLLIAGFARFWATDRLVMRRLRALAALDPDVATVIAARDERRRLALKTLLDRRDDVGEPALALRVAHMLTSFETYDALLSPSQRPGDVVPTLAELVINAVRMPAPTRTVRRTRTSVASRTSAATGHTPHAG